MPNISCLGLLRRRLFLGRQGSCRTLIHISGVLGFPLQCRGLENSERCLQSFETGLYYKGLGHRRLEVCVCVICMYVCMHVYTNIHTNKSFSNVISRNLRNSIGNLDCCSAVVAGTDTKSKGISVCLNSLTCRTTIRIPTILRGSFRK